MPIPLNKLKPGMLVRMCDEICLVIQIRDDSCDDYVLGNVRICTDNDTFTMGTLHNSILAGMTDEILGDLSNLPNILEELYG